jgi:hypothetical protein
MEIEMKFMMKIMQSRFFVSGARLFARPLSFFIVYRQKTLDKFNDLDV